MSFIAKTWDTLLPDFPMEYRFIDETYNNLYRASERMGMLFRYFTTLAILIACLGLFGLSAFMAEQRTKEIGIRKVFGASVSGITVLLIREHLKWVVAANVIAWPLSFYLMTNWLKSFVYRTELYWSVFIISGSLALIIAILTVAFQSIKVSVINPMNSLRYE
jgi:putative ABC transport system permease protein